MASTPVSALATNTTNVAPISPRLRLIELLLVVVVSTLGPYLSSTYVVLYGTKGLEQNLQYRLVTILAHELSALALASYVLFRRGSSWQSIGLKPRFLDVVSAVGLFIGAVVASYTAYVLYSWALFWYGAVPHFQDVAKMMKLQVSVLWIIFMLVNGLFEEGIVRAFLMTDIQALTGLKWLAVLVSVALQAGYHLYQGPSNVAMILPIFFIFSVYFARTGRALPVVVAHAMLDLFWLSRH